MAEASTAGYENTVSGLLRKRTELLTEAEALQDRFATIRNDVDALDLTLRTLGFDGDLDAAMPRQKREVILGKANSPRR